MLANEKRPKTLAELKGQPVASKFLERWLESVKTGHVSPLALMVTGPSGSGKTTLAHVLANELGCDFSFEKVESRACTLDKVLGKDNWDDSIRYWLNLSTWESGGWKVLLIDEAHTMSDAAKDAFLGLLEDIPKRRVLVFTTTEPQAFDLIWRSRCTYLELKPHTPDGIMEMLKASAPDAPEDALRKLAESAQGNARLALNMLERWQLDKEIQTCAVPVTTCRPNPAKLYSDASRAAFAVSASPTAPLPTPQGATSPSGPSTLTSTTKTEPQSSSPAKTAERSSATAKPPSSPASASSSPILRPGKLEGYVELQFPGNGAAPLEERNLLRAAGFRWGSGFWWGSERKLPDRYRGLDARLQEAPVAAPPAVPAQETAKPEIAPQGALEAPQYASLTPEHRWDASQPKACLVAVGSDNQIAECHYTEDGLAVTKSGDVWCITLISCGVRLSKALASQDPDLVVRYVKRAAKLRDWNVTLDALKADAATLAPQLKEILEAEQRLTQDAKVLPGPGFIQREAVNER